ncbi:MAG: tyrosine-type recombinase/integrase [Clostridiales bacterium]|nr:tyrosine-type recombinase/integrase [Clostridiales bacterium]
MSKRDRKILFLLLYTGVRVSELCDIMVSKIDYLTSYLKVYVKWGKIREVPLKPEVVESIKEYLVVFGRSNIRIGVMLDEIESNIYENNIQDNIIVISMQNCKFNRVK